MLDWSQTDLAEKADVKVRTVMDFERGARKPLTQTLSALRNAFEAAGIMFITDGENSPLGGPGLRLRPASESPDQQKTSPDGE